MTANAKHTPGPWKNYAKSAVGTLEKPQGSVKFVADCRTVDTTPDEQYANARLIAAAPELLEALQKIVREPQGKTGADSSDVLAAVIRIARDALRKAEGSAD